MSLEKDLDHWRGQIDLVDRDIRRLLSRRMECALEVANAKARAEQKPGSAPAEQGSSQASHIVYYRPGREAQMMRALAEKAKDSLGAFPTRSAIQIWRELISASIRAQALGLSVAVADETCRLLARAHFGAVSQIELCSSPQQVLAEVEQGSSLVGLVDDAGLVDISNSPSQANVIAVLPFVQPSNTARRYVIGRQPMEESGDDIRLYRLPNGADGAARLHLVPDQGEVPDHLKDQARWLGGFARPLDLGER